MRVPFSLSMPPYQPYVSAAQERWAHTAAGKKALGSEDVHGKDEATKGTKLPEHHNMESGYGALAHGNKTVAETKHPAPKHGIKHTHIEHHSDGSHTIKHTYHKDGSESTHTAKDLDALHDHFEDVMGEPNEGEAEALQAAGVSQAAPAPPQAAQE